VFFLERILGTIKELLGKALIKEGVGKTLMITGYAERCLKSGKYVF